MNIQELHSFKLSDAVKFHDTLNPKLWSDAVLHRDVVGQLKKIADDFIDELGLSELDVKDITVSGSNAAYSYTEHSDLDLHILVDMSKLNNDEIYRELFNAKKVIYNDSHDIKIYDIPVELYVQDSNEPVKSLGEYSVLNDKWIKIPSKRRANFDQRATKEKFEKLASLIEYALRYKKLETVKNIISKIKQYRQSGLEHGGEFGPENLAYKALRSRGYIDKLYDLRNNLHSKDLSIPENANFVGDSNPLGLPWIDTWHNAQQLARDRKTKAAINLMKKAAKEAISGHDDIQGVAEAKYYLGTVAWLLGDYHNVKRYINDPDVKRSGNNAILSRLLKNTGKSYAEAYDDVNNDISDNIKLESISENTIPTKTFNKLYHVGTLSAEKKRTGSYEGAGLSVSTHPDAWRKIARGHVTGDTFSVDKSNNVFIDAHKLNKEAKQKIAAWGVENELIEPAITYRVSYYDDELESEVYSDYDSLEKAKSEVDDISEIKKIKGGYKPTDKLKTLAKNSNITPTGILDYVLPIFAEENGYDGVWWQDRLDVSRYSAPRGVIVPSKVSSWKFNKINESASGYIPSDAEKDDPRFKTALTVDVKPDSIQQNAIKLGLGTIKRSGVPQTARSNGSFSKKHTK